MQGTKEFAFGAENYKKLAWCLNNKPHGFSSNSLPPSGLLFPSHMTFF